MTRKSAKLPEKPVYEWPRKRCLYCKITFRPRADKHGRTQKFCCPNHRKEYEKHGGLQFDRLVPRILKDPAMLGLIRRIFSLEEADSDMRTEFIELERRVLAIEQQTAPPEEKIRRAVTEVLHAFTPAVVRIRWQIEADHAGQPSVFFRVVLADHATKIATKVSQALYDCLDFSAMGLGHYVNFRTASEQAALKEKEWE